MEQKIERVTVGRDKKPIKHLYRRQYQQANGDWATRYYARFTDWKRVRRNFPVGETLDDARDELGRLHTLNKGRHDWDKEKQEQVKAKVKAMTLGEWLDRYFDLMKDMASATATRVACRHLKRLLGHLALSEVSRVRIIEYKNKRLTERKIRWGKEVAGTKIKGSTVNREIACLKAALNLAADEGLCEGAPKVKKEREIQRERILDADEYKALLDASPCWLQRVIIAANETAIDRGVLLKLEWDAVKDGLIVVKGGRDKSGARQRVGISPELEKVLDELRSEYHRVPNTERRIFTKGGKPIFQDTLRHAFDRTLEKAKIADFWFRDFRHCARTRWAANGLPYEIAETGLGHALQGIAGRYINLTDEQIRKRLSGNVSKNRHERRAESGGKPPDGAVKNGEILATRETKRNVLNLTASLSTRETYLKRHLSAR